MAATGHQLHCYSSGTFKLLFFRILSRLSNLARCTLLSNLARCTLLFNLARCTLLFNLARCTLLFTLSFSYIFRIKDLDLGKLGTGFGLHDLPRMPELRDPNNSINFVASGVDTGAPQFRVSNLTTHAACGNLEFRISPRMRYAAI
jgi:hypothetical protein